MTMTEVRTQTMYEMECEEIWENLNRTTPTETHLAEAACSLDVAIRKMNEGLDQISDAVNELSGTVAEDKLISMLNDYENMLCDLKILRDEYKRGRC